MKPENLELVKISPIKIGNIIITKLEIDLAHANYGLDPKTKKLRKKARSNFEVLEIVRIFQLLDGVIIEGMQVDEKYSYFSSEVYSMWRRKWIRIIFCVEKERPRVAGVISLYQIKVK